MRANRLDRIDPVDITQERRPVPDSDSGSESEEGFRANLHLQVEFLRSATSSLVSRNASPGASESRSSGSSQVVPVEDLAPSLPSVEGGMDDATWSIARSQPP